MKYKVLIPEWISDKGIKYLEEHDCKCICLNDCSVENVCENIKDCDAVLLRNSIFNRKVIEAGSKLKIIARHGVGVERIDLEAAKEHGVIVTTTPGANSNSVAEHTMALILACAKKIPFFDDRAREADWASGDMIKTIDVSGKVLGLIGYGKISTLVAKKAALGMDMKVIVFSDRYDTPIPEYVTKVDTMDEIFEKSDFVSFHAPLVPETKNSVNRERLGMMKKTAYFINTARGGVVDEAALYNALKNHEIAGAGLDVFADEPPTADNPLFSLDNIVVSPHNAAHTIDSMDVMAYSAACEIVRVLNGQEPLHSI